MPGGAGDDEGRGMDPEAQVHRGAAALLAANWCEAADGRWGYTRPDPFKYPDQFLWDSCMCAVAWAHVDPARARRELRSLAAAQRPDGHIGHTVFWRGPVRWNRALAYNVVRRRDPATWTIQPPLLGWAWARVHERAPDEGFRVRGVRVLGRLHAWLERERAGPDGLLGILQPDESGLDATPAYDRPLGWRAHPRPGFLLLVQANRRRRFSYRRAVAAGAFHAVDVLVNTAWALSWHGLARLGVTGAEDRAREVTAAIVRRLYDPDRGIFFPRGPGGRPLRVATWAGLAPLALPGLPEEVGRRLVGEHLLHPGRFGLPWPVPSVSADEPSFRPGDTGWPIRRYWRGPSWPFTPPFLVPGLLRLGEHGAARDLVGRLVAQAAREGFREYHDPVSGRGLGGRAFAPGAVLLDLMALTAPGRPARSG